MQKYALRSKSNIIRSAFFQYLDLKTDAFISSSTLLTSRLKLKTLSAHIDRCSRSLKIRQICIFYTNQCYELRFVGGFSIIWLTKNMPVKSSPLAGRLPGSGEFCLSCYKLREILLCVSYLLFFRSRDIDLFTLTLLCWPWTGKYLLGILTIFIVLIYFTHSVYVDVN